MGEHRSTIIIGASIILIVGLVVGWTFISSGQQERSLPLTEVTDKDVMERSAELSHLNIATSENFARQKIYVVSAYLKNVSQKPLRSAEVKMTFTDFDGKPIREYSQKILNTNQKPIPPGTEFRFEVRQENLPRGWNYRVPVTEITKLGY
ncbi:MAG TPA: hypothetical protein VKK06_19075 [Terriglobia bacterium]|nr:hypothetical protein [Terriglobia bacterium]